MKITKILSALCFAFTACDIKVLLEDLDGKTTEFMCPLQHGDKLSCADIWKQAPRELRLSRHLYDLIIRDDETKLPKSGTFSVGDMAVVNLRLEKTCKVTAEYNIEIHGIAGPLCRFCLPNLRDPCLGIISGIEEALSLTPNQYNPLAHGEQKAFQKHHTEDEWQLAPDLLKKLETERSAKLTLAKIHRDHDVTEEELYIDEWYIRKKLEKEIHAFTGHPRRISSHDIARFLDLFKFSDNYHNPIAIGELRNRLASDDGIDIHAFLKFRVFVRVFRSNANYIKVSDLEKSHFLYLVILLGDILLDAHEDTSQIVRGCKRSIKDKDSDAVDIFKGLDLNPYVEEQDQPLGGQEHAQVSFRKNMLYRITFLKPMGRDKRMRVTIFPDGTEYFRARFVQRLESGLKAIHDLEVKKD